MKHWKLVREVIVLAAVLLFIWMIYERYGPK